MTAYTFVRFSTIVHAVAHGDDRTLCHRPTGTGVVAETGWATCHWCIKALAARCTHERTRPDVVLSLDGARRCIDCGAAV